MVTKSASSTMMVYILRSPADFGVVFSLKAELSIVAKYSDLCVSMSECAYMILLRASLALDDVDVEDEDERRLRGVSVSGELGTDSEIGSSSLRSKQTNCTSPVSYESIRLCSHETSRKVLTRVV